MYFRDPSPSHLRYSLDSYKLKNEEKGFKKKEPTRWDWWVYLDLRPTYIDR